ncbi:hypothetical protein ABMC88_11290 [Sulfitobacter sp. HNIBRBA2951]|uniref:hypothetical protein n=1 Tax=Sulfitobacter aquimarinus TaxID=3158557 RepID=UPI0032DF2B37
MAAFLTGIFTGAPLFVWPLLAGLVFLGLRARQARSVPVAAFYALPLMVLLGVRTTSALPAGVWIWAVFALAYGAGAVAGFLLQARWTLGREGTRVRLSGESLTLLVVMVLFWANFVSGALEAVAPAVYLHPLFQAAFAALLAMGSGSFAGRALHVLRLA